MTEQGKEKLRVHEGKKTKPYKCSEGKWTIGRGLNLNAPHNLARLTAEQVFRWFTVGMTDREIEREFEIEIKQVERFMNKFEWYRKLTPARQDCWVNMCFQMGTDTPDDFPSMIRYSIAGDFKRAALEMKYRSSANPVPGNESLWNKQTPNRCKELAEIYERGSY